MAYDDFLLTKIHLAGEFGFEATRIPSLAFPFQEELIRWSCAQGRGAVFADCGLGKTLIQLAWADNVYAHTGKRVLVLAPLAVSHQTVKEGAKFGIDCERSNNGKPSGSPITITNYEKLHLFSQDDYIGVVCDESSILKNYDGKRKALITEFMRMMKYRLLCTATAAPNDYVELGTSSEALGIMGYMDMLTRFFRNVDGSTLGKSHGFRYKHSERLQAYAGKKSFWRFKKHAEKAFWRWICSWARAIRKPSDLGFSDDGYSLPGLVERETVIENQEPLPGELFVRPAIGLQEQREELRATINQRCEKVAEIVNHDDQAVCWCHLNDEADLLEKLIAGGVQVSGKDSDDAKEEKLIAFGNGDIRALITKPKIGAFGLNWQHCNHITFFPSHSYEQYYQGVRRCWRYGQQRDVIVDLVTTKGGLGVMKNLQRKARNADKMFEFLVMYMDEALAMRIDNPFDKKEEIPRWL